MRLLWQPFQHMQAHKAACLHGPCLHGATPDRDPTNARTCGLRPSRCRLSACTTRALRGRCHPRCEDSPRPLRCTERMGVDGPGMLQGREAPSIAPHPLLLEALTSSRAITLLLLCPAFMQWSTMSNLVVGIGTMMGGWVGGLRGYCPCCSGMPVLRNNHSHRNDRALRPPYLLPAPFPPRQHLFQQLVLANTSIAGTLPPQYSRLTTLAVGRPPSVSLEPEARKGLHACV